MFPEGRALEFLIAAIVALVVVGPKDLPMLLRKLGQFMAKVRSMAAEFRASFDEMARQSELDELRKEVEAMRTAQLSDIAKHAGAPEMAQTFDELSQGLTDVGVDLNQGMSFPYAAPSAPTIEVTPVTKAARARKAPSKKAPAKKASAKKAQVSKATAKKAAAKATPAKTASAKTGPAKTAAKPAPAAAKPRARKTAGARA
jgi:sec-independent protein translocase protein TatB